MPRRRSADDEYKYFMELASRDPEAAATEFLERLKRKPTAETIHTIHNLERILQGDQSAWHASARNMTQAVQLLISNTIFKGMGMGTQFESTAVDTVASMISEDVDFMPLTPIQKRLKAIAESYGFIVTQIQ